MYIDKKAVDFLKSMSVCHSDGEPGYSAQDGLLGLFSQRFQAPSDVLQILGQPGILTYQ